MKYSLNIFSMLKEWDFLPLKLNPWWETPFHTKMHWHKWHEIKCKLFPHPKFGSQSRTFFRHFFHRRHRILTIWYRWVSAGTYKRSYGLMVSANAMELCLSCTNPSGYRFSGGIYLVIQGTNPCIKILPLKFTHHFGNTTVTDMGSILLT